MTIPEKKKNLYNIQDSRSVFLTLLDEEKRGISY